MRKIVFATLIAAGVAFAGMSAGSAAPANNTALKQAAGTMTTPMVKVRHCHGYYSHWHWCY